MKIKLFFVLLIAWPLSAFSAVQLVAILPESPFFIETMEAIESELGEDYEITRFNVNKAKAEEVIEHINESSTKGFILLDTRAIVLYRDLLRKDSALAELPRFITMTLQLSQWENAIGHIAGISYEVPGFTIFSNLKRLLEKPVENVGVFYQKMMEEDIQQAKSFLDRENIKLNTICLDCNSKNQLTPETAIREMQRHLRKLSRECDAVWMLPDNMIVNSAAIQNVWMRIKQSKKPLVVPTPSLASANSNFGLYNVSPDHTALGIQLARQIQMLWEDEMEYEEILIEPLLGVKITFNNNVAQELNLTIRQENKHLIDFMVP